MPKRLCIVLAILLAFVMTGAAMARNDKGKHKGNPHGRAQHSRDWQRQGNYEYRMYSRDERPPGWSRGNKTGWRDCALPPGQAKKYGCYTYVNDGRRHYYYQDDRGYIYERRPVIEIHGSVDVRQ